MFSPEWQEITDSIARQMAAKKGQRLVERFGEDGEVYLEVEEAAPATFEIIEASRDMAPGTLARSPKGIYDKALALGWTMTFGRTLTRHDPVFMMKNGKVKKDGSQSMQGDIRIAAHDEKHLVIAAVDKLRKVAFVAAWKDNGFESALIQDPVGIPVENFVDYWKGDGRKPARDYNDGSQRIENRYLFTQLGPFVEWLYDWTEIIVPGFERPVPTVQKTTEETLLEGGDWNG